MKPKAEPMRTEVELSLPRLAWVLHRAGDLETSAAILRRATGISPRFP